MTEHGATLGGEASNHGRAASDERIADASLVAGFVFWFCGGLRPPFPLRHPTAIPLNC